MAKILKFFNKIVNKNEFFFLLVWTKIKEAALFQHVVNWDRAGYPPLNPPFLRGLCPTLPLPWLMFLDQVCKISWLASGKLFFCFFMFQNIVHVLGKNRLCEYLPTLICPQRWPFFFFFSKKFCYVLKWMKKKTIL